QKLLVEKDKETGVIPLLLCVQIGHLQSFRLIFKQMLGLNDPWCGYHERLDEKVRNHKSSQSLKKSSS
ncbi:unnamed protein product, partial [Didymodactylos carnosus]